MDLLTKHPASVGETYFEHMRSALGFAGAMAVAFCCCFIHAFLPFLCEKTGSGIIAGLYGRMVANRSRIDAQAPETDSTDRPWLGAGI